MNGIVLVNKSVGLTSRDVVNKVSRIYKTKKVGHTGTLDPLASGLLVLCINEGTKLVEPLTNHDKEYIVGVKLGLETTTLDLEGSITREEDYTIDFEELNKVMDSFVGSYMQEVPIYSAVKVKGKKLYEYARENKEVVLPKREVEISAIDLLGVSKDTFSFSVTVSKGTYIRSLVRDIALKLNTYGTMTSLIRTRVGSYLLQDSYEVEELTSDSIIGLEEALKDYDVLTLNDNMYETVKNGGIINNEFDLDTVLLLYKGNVIALYKRYDKDKCKLKPWKMFNNTCQ